MNTSAAQIIHGGGVEAASNDRGGLGLRALMTPFAVAIFAKAEALRNYAAGLSNSLTRRLVESIGEDVKKATNFRPHDVSVAAAEAARGLGIDDLGVKTWHDQPKFDPRRTTFLVEHMIPVSALVYACTQKETVEAVLDVLTDRLRVVWLLRAEDNALTLLGFRTKRSNPDEAYRLAGIEIVSKKKPHDGEEGH